MKKSSYYKKTPFAVSVLLHLLSKEETRDAAIKLLDLYNLRVVETNFDPYFVLKPIRRR